LPSMWREIIYGNRRNVIEGLTRIEAEIQRVKEVLSQDDEGQALESYLERSRDIRTKLPYLTGQIKDS
jgi:prephenate dehydrogenase